ncbi:hypothetical protein [Streptomyces sp. Ru71]|nr:hypothetical protein [Streptomyces sp. Ru71]
MDTTTTLVVLPAGVALHHLPPDDIAALLPAPRPAHHRTDRAAPAS